MQLTEKIVEEIDHCDNYARITLLPTFQASHGKMAYLVGEEDEDGYHHYVRLYENGLLKTIFTIENIVNAYSAPLLQENYLAFPEYYEDGWHLLIYNLETNETNRVFLLFCTEGEYPMAWDIVRDQVIYRQSNVQIYGSFQRTDDTVCVVLMDYGQNQLNLLEYSVEPEK